MTRPTFFAPAISSFALSGHVMGRLSYSLALMTLSVLVISCGSGDQQDTVLPPTAQVTVHATSRLVTLDVKDAPVAAVLAAIGQQARITIGMPDGLPSDRLSLAFQNVPLEEALKRLLAGHSYTFAYTQEKGREAIVGVRLFARKEQLPLAGAAPSNQPAIARFTGSQGLPQPAAHAWGRGGATANGGKGAAIGADVPLDELKRAFSEAQDPARKSAILNAMANREQDGPVAPALSTALSDSDESVRADALNLLKTTSELLPLGPLAQMAGTENNPDLRMDAMQLMADQVREDGRTKDEWAAAKASLSRSLSDSNEDVREQAKMLLAELSQ
jgi:hypothetical protein